MDLSTATEQARLALEETCASLNEMNVPDEVPFAVYAVEADGAGVAGTCFLVARAGQTPDEVRCEGWETWSSAVESSTQPGVYCAHLRTYGGGRGDSQGAVCAIPGIWFPLF